MQKLLRDNGYEYDVLNAGVSGDTTADGLRRIDSVLRDPAAILILEFGTNDAFLNVPIETMKENLAEMIRRAQAANVIVVLAGIEVPVDVAPSTTKSFVCCIASLPTNFKFGSYPTS